MSQFTTVVTVHARGGCENDIATALDRLVVDMRSMSGCVSSDLYRGVGDLTQFMLVERWASREAKHAFVGSPQLKAFLDEMGGCIASTSIREMVSMK